MPKKDLLINIGKTFTFKTHSCLEKLRLVANADSLTLITECSVEVIQIQCPNDDSSVAGFFHPSNFALPTSRVIVANKHIVGYHERTLLDFIEYRLGKCDNI